MSKTHQDTCSEEEGIESDGDVPSDVFRLSGITIRLRSSRFRTMKKVSRIKNHVQVEELHHICLFDKCRSTFQYLRDFTPHVKSHLSRLNQSDRESISDSTKTQVVCKLCWQKEGPEKSVPAHAKF